MRLTRIKALHDGLSVPAYHYAAANKSAPYVVWAEDGSAGSGSGDNRITTQIITGTTDLFTKLEDDPAVAEIQTAFNNARVAWRLASVQYEDGTGLLHYEWVWEVPVWLR